MQLNFKESRKRETFTMMKENLLALEHVHPIKIQTCCSTRTINLLRLSNLHQDKFLLFNRCVNLTLSAVQSLEDLFNLTITIKGLSVKIYWTLWDLTTVREDVNKILTTLKYLVLLFKILSTESLSDGAKIMEKIT